MKELALKLKDAAGNDITVGGVANLPGGGVEKLSEILSVGVELAFLFAILLCLAFIIWGGIDWIMAGGNKENINKARQKIVWSVMGLFVVFLSFLIINVLGQFFGIRFYKWNVPGISTEDCVAYVGGTCRFGGCYQGEDQINGKCSSGASVEYCCK